MKANRILILLLFIFKMSTVVSQIDTVFWFAAPWVTPDHVRRDPVKVHIAGKAGTVVRIRQPAAIAPNKYDTTITMTSDTINYTFWRDAIATATNFGFDSLEARPANTVLPYGIKISSTAKITAVYDVICGPQGFNNPETFSLKGQNGLGTEFVCPQQTIWNNQNITGDNNGDGINTKPKQQINIVATLPGTVVWITPRCNIVGHLANVTYSVAMSTGEVYTLENVTINTGTATPGQNLSGTIIVSNNPISVTVADDSVRTPGGGCYDLIGDQIVPVDIIGKEYIANKGFMFAASVESIFIVATDNFTQLTINDGTPTTYTLNKGDTKQYPITQPLTHILATKNVYCYQTTGYGCEAGAAILPPINCAGSDSVYFSRNNTQPFLLNVLCKLGNEGNFTVNGTNTLVTAADFSVVPGTGGNWLGAQKQFSLTQIPLGTSLISNSTDVFALAVINGSFNTGGLFHYMSSFKRSITTEARPDFTICAGSTNTIALSGTITGAFAGIWYIDRGATQPDSVINQNTGAGGVISTIYTLSPQQLGVTVPTAYTVALWSDSECDNKFDILTFTVNPAPSLTVTPDTVTRCKNNLTPISLGGSSNNASVYNWVGGGGTYSPPNAIVTSYTPSAGDATAGSITLTLTATGCSSVTDVVVVNFTNPPSLTMPADLNVCTNSPTVAVSGATISGGSSQGIWSTNGGGYFTPSDTTFNTNYVMSATEQSAGGTVILTLTSINNGLCAAVSNTMEINIFPKPVVNAGPNDTICASAKVFNLNGSALFQGAPTTPTWSAVSGTGSFANINSAITNYSMSANDTIAGFVEFVISAQGICPNAETDTIRIDILKLPFVNAGINTSFCDNSSVLLNGLISGFTSTGQWSSNGTGTYTPGNTALNANYFPSGSDIATGFVTFTLSSTNNKGCNPVLDSVKITFKASPSANFSTGNTCVNDPVAFTGLSSGIISQNWDFGDGTNSIGNNPLHSYTLANTYTVTYVVTAANGCPDTIRKPVTINSLPVSNFSVTSACQNLSTQFTDLSFVNPGNVIKWDWNFNDGTKDTINKNPTHVYTNPGLFNVVLTVTSDKGCKNTTSLPVNVLPKPTAEFGMTNNPTLALENVYFSDFSFPTGTIANWYWNFGDSVSSNVQHPTHFYANQGDYTVTLTVYDQNGCSDTISKSIAVTLLPLVPSAFTPNKDGYNDLMFVRGGPFENMIIRVYNSWGELVFETKDQTEGWDGTYKGQNAPIGVYVWVLDVDMYNNKSVRKTGDITLLR
jgi:gliding motility-associated-like protein